MNHVCPTETVLRHFNEGRIDDFDEIDRISDHLGDCATCIEKLELMGPGPIANGLRRSFSDELAEGETSILEQDLDVDSVRDNVEKLTSQTGFSFRNQNLNPHEFGENQFEIIGSLGEGSFSSVYGALRENRDSDEPTVELVGIKIPHAHKLSSLRHSQQFFNDCQLAQTLVHPGIQQVLEFGRWDEKHLFLSKPLIEHPTLTRFAKSSPHISRKDVISIFMQLVEILDYAHQENVIHRHLTPDNIHLIITQESESGEVDPSTPMIRVVVSDFGFFLDSRYHFDLVEPFDSQTPFISPESATLNAKFIDARADVFSLGKILKLLLRITSDMPDEEPLSTIVENSTAPRRRDRYQSVSELKSALDSIKAN